VKVITAPSGRRIGFGRQIPRVVGPHLKLRNYLRASGLPTPPATLDLSGPATACLREVDLNDQLGDCVIAAKAHVDGVWTGNAGALFNASSAQVLAQYEAIGGYKPGDPSTDQGCDMQTALNWWVQNAAPDGSKLAAWLAVDATNVQELKTALFLFENLYFGMALPDAWISPFPSADGFVWDVSAAGPDANNGHCVMGYGYDATSVLIDSWALFGHLTFAAIADYCVAKSGGELYVLLSTDMLVKGQQLAPNGLSWSQLAGDWDTLGGSVVVPPSPSPAPPAPAPTPPAAGGVSLAQAQAAVTGALAKGGFLMTPSHAETLAASALAAIKGWPA
jgi:hypothetical protein